MSFPLQFHLAELFGPWAVRWHTTPVGAASTTVTLAQHGWRSIARPLGMRITCLRGNAVITQQGDPRDLLLVAGESFTVTRPEHLYVQATHDCELRFTKPDEAEAGRVRTHPSHWQPGVEP